MIDALVPQIEELEAQGAMVILKWDGERAQNRRTVVITRPDTDFVWRKDCEDIAAALADAIFDYKAKHGQ